MEHGTHSKILATLLATTRFLFEVLIIHDSDILSRNVSVNNKSHEGRRYTLPLCRNVPTILLLHLVDVLGQTVEELLNALVMFSTGVDV